MEPSKSRMHVHCGPKLDSSSSIKARARAGFRILIVFGVLMLLALTSGCEDSTSVSPNESLDTDGRDNPDIKGVVEGMAISGYNVENRYNQLAVGSFLEDKEVQRELEDLNKRGYEYEPLASIVAEGRVGPDQEARITIVGLRSTAHGNKEAVFMFRVQKGDYSGWVPVRYIFDKKLAGPETISLDDGTWVEVLNSEGELTGLGLDAALWSWDQYLQCAASCFVAVASACSAGCRFAGPFYVTCMVKCIGVGALYCAINCIFQQF